MALPDLRESAAVGGICGSTDDANGIAVGIMNRIWPALALRLWYDRLRAAQ